jgi:hypothetical protein
MIIILKDKHVIATHDDRQDIALKTHYPEADELAYVPDEWMAGQSSAMDVDGLPPLITDPRDTVERQWTSIRMMRNRLLAASDIYMLPDFPQTQERRVEWEVYRERLRNITDYYETPEKVVWPEAPA